MKKILIYINSMQPAGGIERVVSTLANELCYDYHIDILVKDEPRSFYVLNDRVNINTINVHLKLDMTSRVKRACSLFFSLFLSIIKLRSYFSQHSYDYIYVTTPLSFLECLFTFRVSNKIIASEHGARDNYNRIYKLIKYAYKLAKVYVLPTTEDYRYYLSKGFPASYIPHLRPTLPYIKTNVGQKFVINIGRFTADKRQSLLVSMWSRIISGNPELNDWVLLLVGQGELKKEIEDLINELELSESVKLILPQQNIQDLYTRASIFALTSSSEGFGMVLLEALSFGLPVISFDCPAGPRDIIEDGKDGFLIKNDNVALYESKLRELMLNESYRQSMSESNFIKGQTWNDSEILDKWRELF
ncbi:glycosyltransferase family 4 protein [Aeromonas veronii]